MTDRAPINWPAVLFIIGGIIAAFYGVLVVFGGGAVMIVAGVLSVAVGVDLARPSRTVVRNGPTGSSRPGTDFPTGDEAQT